MSQSTHHCCKAVGCAAQVPRGVLMCRNHWRMVPLDLQRLIWRRWKAVLRNEHNSVVLYRAAVNAAVEAVEAEERQFNLLLEEKP